MSNIILDRFMAKIAWPSTVGGCWIWTASKNPKGYGSFRVGRRTVQTHRFSYEAAIGPIPDGLHIDHLCRRPSCVNPLHMEPVTPAENTRRGLGPTVQFRKSSCPKGHPYDRTNRRGERLCGTCGQIRRSEQAALRMSSFGDIDAFINQRCWRVPGVRTPAPELRASYESWCSEQGVPPMARKSWGIRMRERFGPPRCSNHTRYHHDVVLAGSTKQGEAGTRGLASPTTSGSAR